MKKNVFPKLVIVSVFVVCGILFFLPGEINAATLTSASATLGNPRLSYKARTTAGTAGSSAITIDNSGTSYPDNNTNHLFPGDSVCFVNANPVGCIGNASYSVATVSGSQYFNISAPLASNVDTSGYVIATQSGSISISFTLVNAIPANGDIFLRIPIASTGNVNDGIPDSGTSNTTSGFDFNKLQSTSINVSTSGGTCSGGWNTPVVASASGTIQIVKATSSCTGATVTITIPNMVNPAPFASSHTQGVADVYKIYVATRDGSTNVLDSTNVAVSAIEGVLVSANVDQTLSFTVAGVNAAQSACGITTSVGTQAYAIPWGTLSIANSFYNAAQLLTVSTNASNGYSVAIEENDQMGLNGITCTGTTAGEANSCIKDTTCDSGTCSQASTSEWNVATNNGFGYSLASVSGTPAVFYYGELSRVFSSRQVPDYTEGGEAKQNILNATGPVSNNQAYICYRISISGTQPAGYYYNKVKYTATPRF